MDARDLWAEWSQTDAAVAEHLRCAGYEAGTVTAAMEAGFLAGAGSALQALHPLLGRCLTVLHGMVGGEIAAIETLNLISELRRQLGLEGKG